MATTPSPDLRTAVAGAPRGTRLLEPLVELGCTKPRDLAALGRALLDDARWAEGLDALAMAAERAPADAWDNALWPRDIRAQAGRAAAARALAGLGRVRSRPAVRAFARSRLLQHLDRAEEAAAEFRAAAPLFKGCPWYFHGRLGELLVKAGRMRRALAPLARAARLAPGQARPLCWRAEALYGLGDPRGAARGFAAARLREPRNA
ncbi:MAG: hypothetical protein HY928_00485, partial [Elusimicrobia bacterium]|nr:hypothetical protein [Elusimicrobiota bacterium]